MQVEGPVVPGTWAKPIINDIITLLTSADIYNSNPRDELSLYMLYFKTLLFKEFRKDSAVTVRSMFFCTHKAKWFWYPR